VALVFTESIVDVALDTGRKKKYSLPLKITDFSLFAFHYSMISHWVLRNGIKG